MENPVNAQRRLLMGAALSLPLMGQAETKTQNKQIVSARRAGTRVGLALGGGSARGFAHIGVIKALEKHNIRPEVVVGTSAGSVVGAFYAAGYSGLQMEEVALKIKDFDLADIAIGSKRGMVVGSALQNLVNQYVQNKPIEGLQIPFGAVATNLRSEK